MMRRIELTRGRRLAPSDVPRTGGIDAEVLGVAQRIIDDVKARGDEALLDYTAQFDRATLTDLRVTEAEIELAVAEVGDEFLASIAEAAAYVKETGVDALAVAVGSSHAMTERTAALDHTLIAALRSAVPVPLVLHGSSGVPDEELSHAVRSGMTKINIGTALNQAFTSALTTHLTDHPDPRPYLSLARAAVRGRAHHFLTVLSGV